VDGGGGEEDSGGREKCWRSWWLCGQRDATAHHLSVGGGGGVPTLGFGGCRWRAVMMSSSIYRRFLRGQRGIGGG
jgi:hypothetical protein